MKKLRSEFVSEERASAMRELGAEVIRVKGNYDASLKECLRKSKENNWEIVQEETFAPILYVMKYDSLDNAVALQNGVPQGLSSAGTQSCHTANYSPTNNFPPNRCSGIIGHVCV